MQSAGDTPTVADGRVVRASATLSTKARGCSKAWRLLRSLVIGPAARNPSLRWPSAWASANKNWTERLAVRFTALSLA
ncbi:hypothetical protein MTO96_021843 [Rhipicephalus appendiculatus]